jgi:hypothetical protein
MDGALWHNYFRENGTFQNWANWESLQGVLLGAPSVAAWGPHRLDIFVRGTDNSLWHIWFDGTTGWHAWEYLGGILISQPLVVSSAAYLLDIFVLGLNGALCWRGFHNAWLDWQCLGNTSFEALPTPVILDSNRVDIIGLGSDDHAYHKSMVHSTWSSNWDNLGGPLNSALAATSFTQNQTTVFGIGTDQQMYISVWNSDTFSWQEKMSWTAFGGNFTSLVPL